MISRLEQFSSSIPLLDDLIKGHSDGAAVAKYLDAMDFPAMILAARDETSAVRFLHVNPSFTSLCGYELHEARGKTPALLQGEETDEDAARQFRRELQQDGKGFTTLVNYRKDGTPYEVLLLGTRLRAENDKNDPRGFLFSSFAFFIGDADYVVQRAPING